MKLVNFDQMSSKLPDKLKSVALVPFVNYKVSNLLEMLTDWPNCAQEYKGARAQLAKSNHRILQFGNEAFKLDIFII